MGVFEIFSISIDVWEIIIDLIVEEKKRDRWRFVLSDDLEGFLAAEVVIPLEPC